MSHELTLAEAQKAICQLERDIEATVQRFQRATDLSVYNIDLSMIDLTSAGDARPTYGCYKVRVEVRL